MARSPGTLMEGLSVQPSMGPRGPEHFPLLHPREVMGRREIVTIIEEVVRGP